MSSNIRYTSIIIENSNGIVGQRPDQLRYLTNTQVFQTWGLNINNTLPLNSINSNIYHNTVMTIKGASVGIGTSQPQSTVHVSGNLQVDGIIGNELLQYAPYLPMSPNNSNTFIRWMQYATSYQYRNNFAPTQSLLTGSFWGSNVMPFVRKYDSYTYSTIAAAIGYFGGVLVPDGRVVLVPYNASTIGLFTPSTNTYSTIAFTSPGTDAYRGGLLLPDGRVLFIPSNATTVGLFNPSTNTYSTITGAPGSGAFEGGVLLSDGRALFVPRNSTVFGIFTPSTNTYSTIAFTSPGLDAYRGGVLLPDGRVMLVPASSTNIGIFNPTTNAYSTIVANTGYEGGALLPDGRVILIPRNNTTFFGIFNSITNTYTSFSFSGALDGFIGGVLLPDGRMLFVPFASGNFGFYNPINNTYSSFTGAPGGSAYAGGILLPDGRVVLVPINTTTIGILTPTQIPRPPPLELCYHPCFNKY